MTKRTSIRLFVIVVAILAIALLGIEEDAEAVKKQEILAVVKKKQEVKNSKIII